MTPTNQKVAERWECGPHANAWNGHDARCRRIPTSAVTMTEREPPHRAAWSGNWRDEDNRPGPAAGQPTLAERVAALCDSWEKPGSWPEPVRITFNVCADELRALLEAFEGGGDIG